MTSPEPVVRKAAAKKRPADYTGRLTEQLEQDKLAEKIEASQRIAMVNAELAQAKDDVVDYTGSDEPIPQVQLREVEVATPYRMIRVNTDIEQMTYARQVLDPGDFEANPPRPPRMGPMNFYTFGEGQLYRVTKDVAEHLERLGYIAYMSGA